MVQKVYRINNTADSDSGSVGGGKHMDTTATSDFQNRFKGKIEVMKKDGHIGVVERTGQPITKMT